MSYEFQKGDYIAFNRIIQGERSCGFRTDYATGKAIAVPAIPEQVLPQHGEACITSISKTKRRIKVDRTASGQDVFEKFTVARAVAGKPLGTVTVILDDAVLVAKQDSLFEMAPVERNDHDVYGSDGIA